MNYTLRQLRAFATVARRGSFTRAATELSVSQPALTVQIRELETALGLRLLDRNTRRVQLTAVGGELLPVFERILADIQAVSENARELASGDRGVVNVAALPTICATVLPGVLARLRRTHPGISVRLRDTVAQRMLALVRSEEVELGIGHFAGTSADVEITPLAEDRMLAVFPTGHRLASRRRLGLKDLASHPLVFMDAQSSVRALVERAFARESLRVVPDYEVTYMSTAVGLVKAGLGIAILPSTAIELRAMPGIASRPIASASLRRSIGVARKKARTISPAAEIFLAAVRDALAAK